jgi:hypothetical protein
VQAFSGWAIQYSNPDFFKLAVVGGLDGKEAAGWCPRSRVSFDII